MSDPGELLLHHPRFTWREGMRDRAGVRVFDLDLFDATTAPDLEDWATAHGNPNAAAFAPER